MGDDRLAVFYEGQDRLQFAFMVIGLMIDDQLFRCPFCLGAGL